MISSIADIASRRLEKRLNERFVKAMATYHLIEDDDRILVGLSGGKDSLLLLELLAKRARIDHPRFSVEALHVRMENIHYETDTSYLQAFCDNLEVRLHVRTTRFEVLNEQEFTDDDIIKLNASSLKFKIIPKYKLPLKDFPLIESPTTRLLVAPGLGCLHLGITWRHAPEADLLRESSERVGVWTRPAQEPCLMGTAAYPHSTEEQTEAHTGSGRWPDASALTTPAAPRCRPARVG